jgi:protein LSM14
VTALIFHVIAERFFIVRCKGTEDRVQDPSKKIAPSPNVINFVIFPGNEIQDLYVHEEAVETPSTTPAPPLPTPPKVQEVTISQPPQSVHVDPVTIVQPPPPPVEAAIEVKVTPSNNQAAASTSNRPNTVSSSNAGKGEHLVQGGKGKVVDKVIKESEFDITRALAGFDKQLVLAEVAASSISAPSKYSKDSFFDNLSCEAVDRAEGRAMKLTSQGERKLNLDTFGVASVRTSSNRNGYRGGGGGGRGGYRGRNGGGGRGASASSTANTASAAPAIAAHGEDRPPRGGGRGGGRRSSNGRGGRSKTAAAAPAAES